MILKHHLLLAAAFTLPALAGPPLICHAIEIGDAKSLPWNTAVQGWDGADRSYNVSTKLVADTLALLQPSTPGNVRMETMRRASIYAAREARLAGEISTKLQTRANESGTALAWFDAVAARSFRMKLPRTRP